MSGEIPPVDASRKSYALPPPVAGSWLVSMDRGKGADIVKSKAEEVPPPGEGLNTVIWAVPSAAMSLAGIEAVSCALLTNVVGRSEPFHLTTELEMKDDPVAVSVKSLPPVSALVGEMEVRVGTGFC